jgi:hypothetical protein
LLLEQGGVLRKKSTGEDRIREDERKSSKIVAKLVSLFFYVPGEPFVMRERNWRNIYAKQFICYYDKDIFDVTMCVQTEVVTVDILERLVRAGAYGRGGFSFNGKVASLKKVGECFDCVVDSLEKTVEFVKEVKALTMNSLRKSKKRNGRQKRMQIC